MTAATQPRVTSVEMVIHTSDGRSQTVTFHGEQHRIQVELDYQEDRERDLFDSRLITVRDPTVTATVTARQSLSGEGPLLTIETGTADGGNNE